MPSSNGYKIEQLGQISEPECFINMPDRQAYKSEGPTPPCVNEVKAIPEDDKKANTASAEPSMV